MLTGMRKDGGYIISSIIICVRRLKEGWTASRLGRAERRGARASEAIRFETLRRGSMALTRLSRDGRRVCGGTMTATRDIVL
jgi:hypothetical protein